MSVGLCHHAYQAGAGADQHKSGLDPQNLALQIEFRFSRPAKTPAKARHFTPKTETAVEDGFEAGRTGLPAEADNARFV